MNTDHDIFGLKLGDVTVTDLTKYPFTIDPERYDGIRAILENQEKLKEEGTLIIFNEGSNEINMQCPMYRKSCLHHSPDRELALIVEIQGLCLLYLQEYIFRI